MDVQYFQGFVYVSILSNQQVVMVCVAVILEK